MDIEKIRESIASAMNVLEKQRGLNWCNNRDKALDELQDALDETYSPQANNEGTK